MPTTPLLRPAPILAALLAAAPGPPATAEDDLDALLEVEPEAIAALVPEQAGFRHVRCPSCPATGLDDPFDWSIAEPEVITCRRCGASFPNDEIPEKVKVSGSKEKVPEQTIEVLPGRVHRYPYHGVEGTDARYPGERIYLDARLDDLKRATLARLCHAAAVRHRDRPEAGNSGLAIRAAVILLRFAEVYPGYAVHYDQPGRPQFLQSADLRPPYRAGFQSGKWTWTGARNVPMDLLAAYAILRSDPALDEAGRLLGDPAPRRTIEQDLFKASAEFQLGHPDPHDERSIVAARGLIAVGRLLGDDRLHAAGLRTLDNLAQRGFYHDGSWRAADPRAHRRVVDELAAVFRQARTTTPTAMPGSPGIPPPRMPDEPRRPVPPPRVDGPGTEAAAILALARGVGGGSPAGTGVGDGVRRVSLTTPGSTARGPVLLGGVGLARLASGPGPGTLELELRGFGDHASARFDRLAIRLAVDGRPVLGDLDDLPASPGGWERSTASHNVATVDGLNQRESPAIARRPAPGSDVLFYASARGLQVATMGDRRAYPRTAPLYRRTVALVDDERARYAVDIFQIRGGSRHDQIYHAAAGSSARWRTTTPSTPGPDTLLPPGIVAVPDAPADDGRWFVQAYGAFERPRLARVDGPTQADLIGPAGPLVTMHLLSIGRSELYTADVPDPSTEMPADRSALIVRRRPLDDDPELSSTFVTLIEVPGRSGVRRVGRVESPEGTVALMIETVGGLEHVVVNLTPGTERSVTMADGRVVRTDGLLVRAVDDGPLVLAGGTFAEHDGRRVEQDRISGAIMRVVRDPSLGGRGWFEIDNTLPDPDALAGHAVIVRHGEDAARGWTIDHAENRPDGGARLFVREEPGFRIDPETAGAVYYQFPGVRFPGPQTYRISRITRSR